MSNNKNNIDFTKEKYKYLITHISDVVIQIGLDGKFIYISPQIKDFGFDTKELIGKRMNNYVHPEDLELISKKILEAQDSKEISVEFRTKHKDGYYVPVAAKGSMVTVNGVTSLMGVVRDITDYKMTEQKLKESEEKLKELNRELEHKVLERTQKLKESEEKLRTQNIELKKLDKLKMDFVTIATHELKTPLVSIAGYTELSLIQNKDLDSEIKENLLRVQVNVERLEKHISRLLDVMRIDVKKMQLIPERINIYDLITECISNFQHKLLTKNLEVKLSIDSNLFLIIDSERIYQVFSNLLLNAIKYSPISSEIEISAEQHDNHKLFHIKDHGIGLEPEQIDRLFGKFEMLDQDPDTYKDGSGLGLYISKGIITAHGGEIWATSEGKNKGTQFHFTIPIK